MTHAAHGQDGHVRWLLSPWDHRVHAFPDDKIGDVTAEAVCTHSALASRLSDEDGEKCFACLLLLGEELAERQGDEGLWDIETLSVPAPPWKPGDIFDD